jgi:hypothetical protein
MPILMQVVLALAIAALLSSALVVMLAIQVINRLGEIEGPPDTLRVQAGRFEAEGKTVE